MLNHSVDFGQMQYQPTLVVSTLVVKISVESSLKFTRDIEFCEIYCKKKLIFVKKKFLYPSENTMGHFDPYSDLNRKYIQELKKKAGPRPYSCSSMFKKSFFKKKIFFANFFKYEKEFRGTYNIYKLLKHC